MALRLSYGLRAQMLGTKGIVEALDNGFIDIYTGAQPLSANSVETGLKLCRLTSTSGTGVADGVKFGTAGTGVSAGVIPMSSVPWSGACTVAGVAGWFRFYGSGGTSGTSNSEIRMDGSISVSGADLNLSHTSLAVGAVTTVTSFTISQPAE